jgi:hypothetical protein
MDGERISGTWRVVQSTDPGITKGVDVWFAIVPDGLAVQVQGAATYEIPWSVASLSVASNGQTVIDTGHGTLWVNPGAAADPAQLAARFNANRVAVPPTATSHQAFKAGAGRQLVLYRGEDDGSEVDPARLLAEVAADAENRAADGWQLTSLVGLPLRHAGQKMFGVEGSGYTTKAALAALYVQDGVPASGVGG